MPFKVCRYGIAGLPLASPVSELHSLNSLVLPGDSYYIAMHQTLFDVAEARSNAVTLYHVLSPDIISILSDSFLSPSFLSHFSFFNNFYILYCILHVCIAGSLPCPSSIPSEPAEVDMPDMKVIWNDGSPNFGVTYICGFERLRFRHSDSRVRIRVCSAPTGQRHLLSDVRNTTKAQAPFLSFILWPESVKISGTQV